MFSSPHQTVHFLEHPFRALIGARIPRVGTDMSAATTIVTALATIFTPPSSCSRSWTYEASAFNGVPDGILVQNLFGGAYDTSCFHPGYTNDGRGYITATFRPGFCSSGYTSPAVFSADGTTTAVCCPRYCLLPYLHATSSRDFRGNVSAQKWAWTDTERGISTDTGEWV